MIKQGVASLDKNSTVSIATVDAQLRRLEEKYNLLQYTVDGWSIWPWIRFSVASGLRGLPRDRREKFPYLERIRLAFDDVVRLIALPKARYVVKTNSLPRSEKQDGLYKDVYFDDLLLEIGSYYKIEDPIYKVFIKNRKVSLVQSDLTSTAFTVVSQLLARLGLPPGVHDVAERLSRCLNSERTLDDFTPQRLSIACSHFFWSKKFYAWLLRRIQPEYLFLITAYSSHNVVAAAKEQGIKVIEFQHGLINRYHPGYSWSAWAAAYKGQMPIPDRLFLYGEYWKQELMANGFWDKELRVVGSSRIDQYRQSKAKQSEHCLIVFTAQNVDTQRLIAFLSHFLEVSRNQLDFRLYIKLHPGEQNKDIYETAFGHHDNVQVLLGREQPSTFHLLSQANFHVSISSTCHYEALALGVPTIILPLAGFESVIHLYQEGHAFLAQTPQELLDIIMQNRSYRAFPGIGNYYFKPGALENVKKELICLSKARLKS
jgi:hypothetical protein